MSCQHPSPWQNFLHHFYLFLRNLPSPRSSSLGAVFSFNKSSSQHHTLMAVMFACFCFFLHWHIHIKNVIYCLIILLLFEWMLSVVLTAIFYYHVVISELKKIQCDMFLYMFGMSIACWAHLMWLLFLGKVIMSSIYLSLCILVTVCVSWLIRKIHIYSYTLGAPKRFLQIESEIWNKV